MRELVCELGHSVQLFDRSDSRPFCSMMPDIFSAFYLEIEKDCFGVENCKDIFEPFKYLLWPTTYGLITNKIISRS